MPELLDYFDLYFSKNKQNVFFQVVKFEVHA